MKEHNLTRRDFIRRASMFAGAAAAAPLLAGCNHAIEATDDSQNPVPRMNGQSYLRDTSEDIILRPDPKQLAETLKGEFESLKTLAQQKKQKIRIVFPTAVGTEAIGMSIVAGGAALYRHVRLVRESSGEVANLLWGRTGVHPSIKLTDDRGVTLRKNGRPLEFSFELAHREGRGPRSWLELGIKIAAIALLVWLGASILNLIIAAIAFIAFNAMVIGILIAGVALFVTVIRWILSVTGWTLDDVAAFFRRTVEELKQFLAEVVAAMGR